MQSFQPSLGSHVPGCSLVKHFLVSLDTSLFWDHCQTWYDGQTENVGETILTSVCPYSQMVQQARAQNSGFKDYTGSTLFLSRKFFHRVSDKPYWSELIMYIVLF